MREQIDYDKRTSEHVRFFCDDRKGREIGARVELAPGTSADGNATLAFRPSATRNGVAFGPLQWWRHFASTDERDAAVFAYLEAARKRAAKNSD